MVRAFAHEVIDRTQHPTLRADLHRALEDRLAEAAGRKA